MLEISEKYTTLWVSVLLLSELDFAKLRNITSYLFPSSKFTSISSLSKSLYQLVKSKIVIKLSVDVSHHRMPARQLSSGFLAGAEFAVQPIVNVGLKPITPAVSIMQSHQAFREG